MTAENNSNVTTSGNGGKGETDNDEDDLKIVLNFSSKWSPFYGFKDHELRGDFNRWFWQRSSTHFRVAFQLILFPIFMLPVLRVLVLDRVSNGVIVGDLFLGASAGFGVVFFTKFSHLKARYDIRPVVAGLAVLSSCVGTYSAVAHSVHLFDDVAACARPMDCHALDFAKSDGLISDLQLSSIIHYFAWSRTLYMELLVGFLVQMCGIVLFVAPLPLALGMAIGWQTMTHITRYTLGDCGAIDPIFELIMMTSFVAPTFIAYTTDKNLRDTFMLHHHLVLQNQTLKRDLNTVKRLAAFQEPTAHERLAVEEAFENDQEIKKHEIKFDSLELLTRIGQGAMGEIIKAVYMDEEVAVKRVLRGKITEKTLKIIRSEVTLMCRLKHRNIITFIGASWDNPANICVVMELGSRGCLSDLLRDPAAKKFTWTDPKLAFASDVAAGMAYLHSRKPMIIHRDLKADNILVSEYYVCKITDFGLSREMNGGSELTMTAGTGTPLWLAPEVIKGDRYTETADVYSFAMLMVELATLDIPYGRQLADHPNLAGKVLGMISRGEIRPHLPNDLLWELRGLIEDCWTPEPAWRPSFKQVTQRLKHLQAEALASNSGQAASEDIPSRYSLRLATRSEKASGGVSPAREIKLNESDEFRHDGHIDLTQFSQGEGQPPPHSVNNGGEHGASSDPLLNVGTVEGSASLAVGGRNTLSQVSAESDYQVQDVRGLGATSPSNYIRGGNRGGSGIMIPAGDHPGNGSHSDTEARQPQLSSVLSEDGDHSGNRRGSNKERRKPASARKKRKSSKSS